ncbi:MULTISPECIES: DUF1345 domain-containing protein [unclassified Sphingopyxis]|uniref:DUF1345 domain-containing protein n=1 Tax=unclassified Sphingopyxis TaxID=2614943 RepID=UPI0024ADDEE2|nr:MULTISPECIES: DUF1345 domain-containing protein [unclassified Sphingopyxis]
MSRRAKLAVGRHIAPVRFLLFAAVFAGVAGALAALGDGSRTALLMGFDAAALVFLAASLTLLRSDAEQMRGRAVDNDANRAGLLAISVLLSLVVLFAVGTLIASPERLDRGDIVLIVATLLLAWLFANMVFTLHYAHLYYLQEGGRDRGGLEVPGVKEPGYWDFLYFSFTLGMTFQTSDVTISGAHMRRVALGHCMAAFVFNMGILAFTVNALGGS